MSVSSAKTPVTEVQMPGNGKTAVIAEDNAVARRCLKDNLTALGYDVVGAAANGQAAVELVEQHRPSLVVMDVKMPRLNGIEAARAISAKNHVPIILVTGHSSDETAAAAVDAGVFAYLVKPVTKKQLMPAIKLAVSRCEQFTKLEDEVRELKETIESRKLIEKAKGILMKRCNIGEEEAFKLLQGHSQKENKKMTDIARMVIDASKLI